MKKITKKLLISVMVLMAAVSLAATSTYAWFTMNDTPDVQGFDVNVTTVDGLYISLTPATGADPADATAGLPGTFKSYVTASEVLAAILAYNDGAYANDTALKSLTHGTTTGNGSFTQPSGVTAPASATETNHYTFRLYFRSNNQYQVKLNLAAVSGESYLTSRVTSTHDEDVPYAKAWADGLAFDFDGTADAGEYDLGDDLVANAKDAVRIGFYDGTTRNFWDPNAGKGFSNDATAAENVAFQYYNQINYTDLTLGTIVTCAVDASTVLMTLAADAINGGYAGYMDITLWLEGWDANAFNSILADVITTTLQFKGAVVA